jgi:hypothetical protein
MTNTPVRRWFQFHLSTTVVLTIAAGAFVALNATTNSSRGSYILDKGGYLVALERNPPGAVTHWRGIPFKFECYTDNVDGYDFQLRPFLYDLAIALAGLAVIAVACEWIIRRR